MSRSTHGEEGPVVEAGPGVVLGSAGDEVGACAKGRHQPDDDVAAPARPQRHVRLQVLQEVDVAPVAVRHLDRRLGHGPTCKKGDFVATSSPYLLSVSP